jgi:hypothetical protein
MKRCDVCGTDNLPLYYDAASRSGRWGNFCPICFPVYCKGNLGTGVGQMFCWDTDNKRYVKVAG